MSVLLYCVGALAFVAGVVMVGFGIPVSEFSFGNTMISAGTTAAIGGLIVVGLGAAVAQLQRIVETLGTPAPLRSPRPTDIFDPARAAPAPSRIPFPSKPKADQRGPAPAEPPAAMPPLPLPPMEDSFAPVLRNPDEPPVTVEDDVSLSPQQSFGAPAAGKAAEPRPSPMDFDADDRREETRLDDGWRPPARQSHSTYFDAMWPADSKPARPPLAAEVEPEPMPELPPLPELPPMEEPAPVAQAEPEAPPEPQALPEPEGGEARTVAILKSGVVDGMGYTLYVDGSIEAELPQGTLRFASINELRSHLEQNS